MGNTGKYLGKEKQQGMGNYFSNSQSYHNINLKQPLSTKNQNTQQYLQNISQAQNQNQNSQVQNNYYQNGQQSKMFFTQKQQLNLQNNKNQNNPEQIYQNAQTPKQRQSGKNNFGFNQNQSQNVAKNQSGLERNTPNSNSRQGTNNNSGRNKIFGQKNQHNQEYFVNRQKQTVSGHLYGSQLQQQQQERTPKSGNSQKSGFQHSVSSKHIQPNNNYSVNQQNNNGYKSGLGNFQNTNSNNNQTAPYGLQQNNNNVNNQSFNQSQNNQNQKLSNYNKKTISKNDVSLPPLETSINAYNTQNNQQIQQQQEQQQQQNLNISQNLGLKNGKSGNQNIKGIQPSQPQTPIQKEGIYQEQQEQSMVKNQNGSSKLNQYMDQFKNKQGNINRPLHISQTPKLSNSSSQFYFGKGYSNTPNAQSVKTKQIQKQNNTNKIMESFNNGNNQINKSNQYSQNNQNVNNEFEMQQEEMLPLSQIPLLEPSKTSSKNLGIISSYGANTHQGTVRNYNEDRVSIILNMMKPKNKQNEPYWPTCSFFGIYDGHGGQNCAEFLRDQLHYFIIQDEYFPKDPQKAIMRGFEKAEDAWTEKAENSPVFDKAGSCAIVVMLIDNMCYSINLGDSRAVLSEQGGKIVTDLSTDHKPSEPGEEKRITNLGGKIYQSQIPIVVNNKTGAQQIIKGPFRVLPGRLAVSRTIGDSEAKLPKYGGIKNVVSAEPDIIKFEIKDTHDFIFLGCDGIFDKMTNQEVINYMWEIAPNHKSPHEFVGKSIERIMQLSMMKKSFDNVTCVVVGFKNLENILAKQIKGLVNTNFNSSNNKNNNRNNNNNNGNSTNFRQ